MTKILKYPVDEVVNEVHFKVKEVKLAENRKTSLEHLERRDYVWTEMDLFITYMEGVLVQDL